MASEIDRLSVPEGDNVIIISPQGISRQVTAGNYILMKKKNVKGIRTWEQFWIDQNACSCTPGSKVYSVYKIFSVITHWELRYK